MMFDPQLPPAAGSKGSVPMDAVHNGALLPQARPRGAIVGKDEPCRHYHSLVALRDDRIAVGYAGPYVGSPRGLQIRTLPQMACAAEIEGAGPPQALSADGRFLLAGGPLSGGCQASLHCVNLNTLTIDDTLPLCRPFLWLAGTPGAFIAQPPYPHGAGFVSPSGDQTWLEAHSYLHPYVQHYNRLVVVDPGKRRAAFLCEDNSDDSVWSNNTEHLALLPDGRTLYIATQDTIAAFDLEHSQQRWRRTLRQWDYHIQVYSLYALALSKDGKYLAMGGIAGPDDSQQLVVLDGQNGDIVLALALYKVLRHSRIRAGSSVRALAWHPSGWLAVGSSNGTVLHVGIDGAIRAYAGAQKGIEALCCTSDGRTLLVAGSEAAFRAWPLLEDEIEDSYAAQV